METKVQPEAVEKQLSEQLSGSGLNKIQLSEISRKIVALQRSGAQIIDWSVVGQPPFEKLVIESQIPFEKPNAIQTLLAEKSLKDILILKRGIPPMQIFFNVKATLENSAILKQ